MDAVLQNAFREGRSACRAGRSNIDNPYTGRNDDGLEEAWNEGWFDYCDEQAELAETGAGWDF